MHERVLLVEQKVNKSEVTEELYYDNQRGNTA